MCATSVAAIGRPSRTRNRIAGKYLGADRAHHGLHLDAARRIARKRDVHSAESRRTSRTAARCRRRRRSLAAMNAAASATARASPSAVRTWSWPASGRGWSAAPRGSKPRSASSSATKLRVSSRRADEQHTRAQRPDRPCTRRGRAPPESSSSPASPARLRRARRSGDRCRDETPAPFRNTRLTRKATVHGKRRHAPIEPHFVHAREAWTEAPTASPRWRTRSQHSPSAPPTIPAARFPPAIAEPAARHRRRSRCARRSHALAAPHVTVAERRGWPSTPATAGRPPPSG